MGAYANLEWTCPQCRHVNKERGFYRNGRFKQLPPSRECERCFKEKPDGTLQVHAQGR